MIMPGGDAYWGFLRNKAFEDTLKKSGGLDAITEWTRFYSEFFKEWNFSGFVLPDKQEKGFKWLIVVPKGMTINRVIRFCRKHFEVYANRDDLDGAVTQNDRNPDNGDYAIWVRDRIEADEENKCLSANILKKKGIAGITLLERILLEAWYFWKFKKHLDIKNATLCSGSRNSGGAVPYVNWRGAQLRICWCRPNNKDDRGRARSVISYL